MGNAISETIIEQNTPKELDIKVNKKQNKIETIDDDEVFKKILNISNEIFTEYNTLFLQEDFCTKFALVYEKKLSNLDIKILKSLYTEINSNKIDEELLVKLQYLPKNDEKFIDYENFFKDTLVENFWEKNIKVNPDILKNKEKDIKNNIVSYIKYNPKYIDKRHVNEILNNIKNNDKNSNKLIEKVGGFIDANLDENNKEYSYNNNLNIHSSNNNPQLINNNNQPVINKSNNQPTIIKSNNQPAISKSNNQSVVTKSNNQPVITKSNNQPVITKPVNQETQILNTTTQQANDKLIQKKYIEQKTNQIIAKNTVYNKLEPSTIIENKTINKLIKYYVPKNFQITSLCKNKYNCELTKKELCQSISENLIIKNNIIAAILTTIPYKNSEGDYEGGICYKKFLNLDSCKVCLPDNYRSLIKKSVKDVLPKILEKADYLDKKICKERDGIFYELTNEQKQILIKKLNNITSKDIEYNPKIINNIYYTEFRSKLKNTYFENLSYLIEILNRLKSKLIFSNKILNEISNQTKKIIDDTYNICHYYYVYGIYTLINLDIKEDDDKNSDIGKNIHSALKKKITK